MDPKIHHPPLTDMLNLKVASTYLRKGSKNPPPPVANMLGLIIASTYYLHRRWWWWWWWSWITYTSTYWKSTDMAFQKYATLPQFRRGATSGLHRTYFNMCLHVFTSIKEVFPAFFHNFSFPLKQMHFPKTWPAPQLRWRLKFQDIEPFLVGALRQGDRHLWRGARHVRHLGNRGEGCVRYQETKRSREYNICKEM